MKFKTKRAFERAILMSGYALLTLRDGARWAAERGLPFVVTETFTTPAEDLAVGRQHLVHQEGRGWDLSIKGWTQQNMKDFEEYMEKKWGHLGAVTSSGKRNLIELHTGTALHFHVQVEKQYAVKAKLGEQLYG